MNPYIIILEDKSRIHLYSMIEQANFRQQKLSDCKKLNILIFLEFLQFVEILNGSI